MHLNPVVRCLNALEHQSNGTHHAQTSPNKLNTNE
ncbi:Uncharacterised protein [Vibrio cholerae]|nr:Uncharacterised protein [Vibrio cholerae]CSI06680.1 Uncharacterised protein [Vibrio cholerae]